MSPVEAVQRRRVVVCDGPTRHEVAVRSDMTVLALLQRVGITEPTLRLVVRDRAGGQLALSQTLQGCEDGDVLTVIDPGQTLATASRATRTTSGDTARAPVWALLGVVAVLTVVLVTLSGPHPTGVRVGIAVLLAVAAATTGIAWSLRAVAEDVGTGSSLGPLALGFAAAAVVLPPLPAGGIPLGVVCGFAAIAVLSGVMALVARSRRATAGLGVTAMTAALLALLWGLALALALPAASVCAVTLGAAPAVLRMLPTTLVNVPSGMFLDFARFQTLRWSVRQREPGPAHAVQTEHAQLLVGRSLTQWTAGTALLCLSAAVGAPFALAQWRTDDILTLIGQIALATCVVLALTLQTRRVPRGPLHWMPRTLAAIALISAAVATVRLLGGSVVITLVVAAALAVGLFAAGMSVPAGRGMRSLSWSRAGDIVESLTIALALPAGLLAASAIDVLRGMMGA